MNRGLYTAAAGMLAGVTRQETVTHNLANMRTVGYKADRATLTDFPALLLTEVRKGQSVAEVGTAGTGVTMASLTTDFQDGPLSLTDHPFDFAVAGEGFFRLQTPDGIRYTRDGRFNIDVEGNLLSADGYYVLGADGPITLPDGDVAVAQSGVIFVDGEETAQFSLANFDDVTTLIKDGQTMFTAGDAAEQLIEPAQMQIYQGYLEGSNVDTAQMVTEMTTIMRAYQFSQQMVQFNDRINSIVTEIGSV